MIARFVGWCRRCDGDIRPGDDVVRTRSGLIHRGCASGQEDA